MAVRLARQIKQLYLLINGLKEVKNFDMKTLLKILILSAVLICGCVNNQSNIQEFKKHIVAVEITDPELIGESLIDSLHFIKLETNENCLMSEIEELFVDGNRIYTLSKNGVNSGIFVFDITGKFLYTINNQGRGPGEYVMIGDFCIQNNVISLTDPQTRSVLQYNATNGSFIKEVKTSFRPRKCEAGDGFYYFSTIKSEVQDTMMLIVTDSDLSVENSFFDYSMNKFNYNYDSQLINGNNRPFWMDPMLGKVYSLEKGNIIPLYEFDFGEKTLLKEQYDKCETTKDLRVLNKAYGFQNLCIYNKHLFVDFGIGDKAYRLHYDISKNKAVYYDRFKSKVRDSFAPLYTFENYGYASINAGYYIRYIDDIKKKNIQNVSGIYPDVTINDNPLIVRKKYK